MGNDALGDILMHIDVMIQLPGGNMAHEYQRAVLRRSEKRVDMSRWIGSGFARQALTKGDVKLILPWVAADQEGEIRKAFDLAMVVRRLVSRPSM